MNQIDDETKLQVWNDIVNNSVLIPKEELIRLRLRDMQLDHLEEEGVNNWSNYSIKPLGNIEDEMRKELGMFEHEEYTSGGLKLSSGCYCCEELPPPCDVCKGKK